MKMTKQTWDRTMAGSGSMSQKEQHASMPASQIPYHRETGYIWVITKKMEKSVSYKIFSHPQLQLSSFSVYKT